MPKCTFTLHPRQQKQQKHLQTPQRQLLLQEETAWRLWKLLLSWIRALGCLALFQLVLFSRGSRQRRLDSRQRLQLQVGLGFLSLLGGCAFELIITGCVCA
jgi:hypothetical protein